MSVNPIIHDITTRELHAMDDLNATIDLQKAVWQMQGNECSSAYIQNAIIHNGGNVLCAEHEGKMVGFCLGFPAKRGKELWLWSHMAGVLPEYQGHGIGLLLKLKQRSWALDNGYSVIGWTFDPMQRGNANFNLRQLGAIANKYYVNHYGEMKDGINAGLASDRLEAYWELQNPRVIAVANGSTVDPTPIDRNLFVVRYVGGDDVIYEMPTYLKNDQYWIEIPRKISTLKQTNLALAQDWQLVVRKAIVHLLSEGFVATDFISESETCAYRFTRA